MGRILKGGGGLHSRLVVGAVLLAAGAGLRMGGRPKALLELGGVPLIRRQLIALSGAGVDEVVVVLGHHADLIEPVVQAFPVTVVRNPSPDNGQVSSQRLGLQALAGKLDAVMVALADQPLINAQDLTALLGAYKKRPPGTSVVFPQVNGDPGNPVIFSAELREQLLAGDARIGWRQWRRAHPGAVRAFVTDNRRYRCRHRGRRRPLRARDRARAALAGGAGDGMRPCWRRACIRCGRRPSACTGCWALTS